MIYQILLAIWSNQAQDSFSHELKCPSPLHACDVYNAFLLLSKRIY